jgi:hypothetical protein
MFSGLLIPGLSAWGHKSKPFTGKFKDLIGNPTIPFHDVQIFKATKEGKFLGQSDFAHLCQAEIICYDGKAQAKRIGLEGIRKLRFNFIFALV